MAGGKSRWGIHRGSRTPLSWASPIDVVVASHNRADRLEQCLDGLAAQRVESPFNVTVIDRVSRDGSADIALAHPIVSRVLLSTETDPLAPCQRGGYFAHRPIVAFIDAACVPSEEWLAAGVAALIDGTDVAVGPDASGLDGALTPNLFVNRDVIERIGFMLDDGIDAFYTRAANAGFNVCSLPGAALASEPPQRHERPALSSSPPQPRSRMDLDLVSVVVCTRGRPQSLDRCLQSLCDLEDDHYEILVVDNEKEPAFTDGSLPPKVRHVHERRLGLDFARNRGVEEAKGEIVAFIDDDCTADRGWIGGLRRAFDDPSVGMVSGRVIPAELSQESQRWFEAWFSFDRGPTEDRFTWHDRREWFPLWTGLVGTGANMAFRREPFLRFATFDPALDMGTPVGGGGDLDIFAQYLDYGGVIAYAPDAVVRHYHRDNSRALRRQFFGYGVSVGALCIKYALGRSGVRRVAVRFYIHQLRLLKRKLSASLDDKDEFPASLLVAQTAGQLLSPLLYSRAKTRARRMGG